MAWTDLFRFFNLAFTKDPIAKKSDVRDIPSAGITATNATIDSRNLDSLSAGGAFIRVQNELIDTTSATNRTNRYKEYDQLVLSTPEIDMAMTVFADEACVAGSTLISTVYYGPKPIEWLAKNKADEKFPVYCYDFNKKDYTIGWAYAPRLVKTDETVQFLLDNGTIETVTADHRILKRDGTWVHAGDLKFGDELMPFYRVRANEHLTKMKQHQFPRIYSFNRGWVHERQFIDEWRLGEPQLQYEYVNKVSRLIHAGFSAKQLEKTIGTTKENITSRLLKHGFSYSELRYLRKKRDKRRIIGVTRHKKMEVYDLSVEEHKNFCTTSCVMHNCQRDEEGRVFKVVCKDKSVQKELEYMFFHRDRLNLNQQSMWDKCKRIFIKGDGFWEIVVDPDDPQFGVVRIADLPPETMFRIETTKGKVLEFQQSKEAPDYQAIVRAPIQTATQAELEQSFAIRFAPEQIVHVKIGDYRRTFYPYGVSLIEPARGPAHQLRMMEDSMVVYRLSRAPERRVFYIDVGNLPGAKAEAILDRIKDQFRKKKVPRNQFAQGGASAAEERYHAPAQDEDFWVPIRPQSNTRIDTLPGACLALDTKIPLLDGRVLMLSEIIEEYNNGKELWAYSCNPKDGGFAPGKITWAGVTRKNTQVVKITLDDGTSFVCTPDHKFPVIGKGKVEAKDLLGESLIAFNTQSRRLRSNRKDEYLHLYDNKARNWVPVHRIVAESCKNTAYERQLLFSEKNKDLVKNTVHHKDFNKYNNSPDNLCWMSFEDHMLLHSSMPKFNGDKISQGLKNYHENLDEESKVLRDNKLKELSKKGSETLNNKLKDSSFREEFVKKQKEGWEKARIEHPDIHKSRGEKITKKNLAYWANEQNKKEVFAKQTINYPKEIVNFILDKLANNVSLKDIVNELNSNKQLLNILKETNAHLRRESVNLHKFSNENVQKALKQHGYNSVRKARESVNGKEIKSGRPKTGWSKEIMNKFMALLKEGKEINEIIETINNDPICVQKMHEDGRSKITRNLIYKMLNHFGYKNLNHAKEHVSTYNHRVVKVEYLQDTIDTGTLTIDGHHELHDYHTFAICINSVNPCGVYTYNSNLGEIDDTVYFRNKLFTALNFPKNYFSLEDPNATRITLSAQDVKFARMIERLQAHIEEGLYLIADRHLRLKGYPESSYEDLKLKMTPPSDWRELSRAEITTNRINNANSLKSAQLLSDFDILTEWMKYSEDDAREKIARMKVQKLEDLKLQVLAQNPILLGVGIPGQGEQEMGAEPGGPNPMLGPPPEEGQPPAGPPPEGGVPPPPNQSPPLPPPPQEEGPGMLPPSGQAKPLPDVSFKDAVKYDMEIEDYESQQDVEETDPTEEEDAW